MARTMVKVRPRHRARPAEFASLSAAGTTNIARRWHRQCRDRCQLVAALLAAVTASPTNRDKSRPQSAAPIAGGSEPGLFEARSGPVENQQCPAPTQYQPGCHVRGVVDAEIDP